METFCKLNLLELVPHLTKDNFEESNVDVLCRKQGPKIKDCNQYF